VKVTIWGVIAAIWVAWCLGAIVVGLVQGDWAGLCLVVLIMGVTMPNYAKYRRRQ
jgi:hypothetical protein